MSEPQRAVAMPGVAGGPTMFEGATIGTIQGGTYYNIQGNATFNTTVHVHSQNAPPYNAKDAVEEVASMLERFGVSQVEFGQIHQDIVDKRTEGTGQSFKARREVQDWIDGLYRFLWITGGPGAGKTFLASVMIDEIESIPRSLRSMTVAFAYLRYTEMLTTWSIILSLIIQLVLQSQEVPSVAQMVQEVVEKCQKRRAKPSLDDLVKLLKGIIGLLPNVCIIIDGLDEMLEEVQRAIIKILADIECRVLFTSRPMLLLEDRVKTLKGDQAVFLNVTAQPEDLDIFINTAIEDNPSLSRILQKHKIKEEVVATIKEKAGGMFLHASLQVEMLQRCRTIQAVRAIISQIPQRIEDLYANTLQRVPDEDSDLAHLVLTWLVHIKGTISVEDLQHAVAVTEDHHFEEGLIMLEEDIISICRGLVVVEGQTRQVRLIHYTAQAALSTILTQHIPRPHEVISRTCLTRLIDCGLQRTAIKTVGALKKRFRDTPLLEYANLNGPYHTRQDLLVTNHDFQDWVEAFCLNCESYPYFPDLVAHVSQIVDTDAGARDTYPVFQLGPLHAAALFGLVDLVSRLCQQEDVDVNDNSGGCTSLGVACMEGDVSVVDALFDNPDLDIDLGLSTDEAPLELAAMSGSVSVVQRLLNHGKSSINEPNSRHGFTPLMFACVSNQELVVQALLEIPGIDVNVRESEYGFTALMIASRMGYEGIVKLLLAVPNIEINWQETGDGCTAFMMAAYEGTTTLVELFLQRPDLDISIVDKKNFTILFVALSYHLGERVEEPLEDYDPRPVAHLLLDHLKVQQLAHIPDVDGRTPLMLAAMFGYKGVVERLLAIPGGDVNAVTVKGQSALDFASERGHVEVVELLLAAGATRS